jgi:hypothetical protein
MKMQKAKLFSIVFTSYFLLACAAGHDDFVSLKDNSIGTKMVREKPYYWEDSGELIRGDYVVSGKGLTKIDTDSNGNVIYHYSIHEILPNTRTEKEWVGKCLIYYVVDPKTYIVKGWGFDEGGNPLSCRTFT